MRIGIVAYEMEGSKTGVGRYLEGLLQGLEACERPWRWLLFFKGDPFAHPLFEEGSGFIPVFDRRPRARPILWEQLRLPRLLRRAQLDFVFSPAYSLPSLLLSLDTPAMLTVHDLSFERLPDEFDWKERWRRRFLARRSVKRAARVLADTGEIARELEAAYALPVEKIGVVPIGIETRFLRAAQEQDEAARLAPYGISPPYLLYLGSILPRRRVDLIIGAFADVAARFPNLKLVLAGENRLRHPPDLARWIRGSGFAERILEVGYIGEDALLPLYRQAELTYYLSSYEGYGLPPLESLATGTPAVVGRGLALDDLWPEYPYRAASLDRATAAAITRRALENEDERRRIGEEGARRMAKLDWRHSAELFLAEVDRAMAT